MISLRRTGGDALQPQAAGECIDGPRIFMSEGLKAMFYGSSRPPFYNSRRARFEWPGGCRFINLQSK